MKKNIYELKKCEYLKNHFSEKNKTVHVFVNTMIPVGRV